ncbi:MAG: DUF3052 domain-containing protein [Bryobacteraceae bacterium]
MGQELACRLRYREKTLSGKAHLETDFVLFRGEERLKIPFKDLTAVEAADGILRLEFAGSEAAFELGTAAAKWAGKILHPPLRLDKLGVKPGSAVALIGEFDADFLEELRARKAEVRDGRARADLVFLAASGARDLARIPKLIARLAPRGAMWVVYPKGVSTIREVEVIQAGRAAGLKDTKVAAFSPERTALRFSLPAAR